jgi:hypothetical protein
MPLRFLLLERIAFSLVVTSAVACSAFLAYEQIPDVRIALHDGEALMRESAKYSVMCEPSKFDPCTELNGY